MQNFNQNTAISILKINLGAQYDYSAMQLHEMEPQ